jgi:hypothetical protein
MTAPDLADEYDALMAQVFAVADGCSPADWTTNCANEQRPIGVMFDHIAEINADVVRWVQEFLSGRPVELTRETITQRNAQHMRTAAMRPREETLRDLKAGSLCTSEFLRSLTGEQLAVTQERGWAGAQTVGWVASVAIRHPASHLKSIREALDE